MSLNIILNIILKRVSESKILIEDSRKRELLKDTQLEDFESNTRKFQVKLLIQNTELKLAWKEEKENGKYIFKCFLQNEVKTPDDEFLEQEILPFSCKLSRIVELRKKVCSDKTEVANALLKTESTSRI